MDLTSFSSRHVHLDMKLFTGVQNGPYAMDISNSGLSSTGLCLLQSAGRYYNIPLCHTYLCSNQF